MAIIELFKLFGTILIDNDPANKKLDETDAKAGKVGNTLAGTIKTAAKWGAAIAAGAAAAGTALFALVNRVTNVGSEIDAKRKMLGITSEALQEYRYAADQVGVPLDAMERALGRLNQRIGLAERGNEKYRKSLDELGVTSRDTSEAFVQAIEALHQMPDANARAAAAADLFGTQLARQLMPIIEEGGEGLLALRNRAHELGKVMDQDSTIAANNFQSALSDVRGVIGGISQDLVMRVLPTFEKWMVWIADNLPKAWAVFEFLVEVVAIVFKYMRLIIGDGIKWMRENAIGPFVTWLTDVWQERGPPIIAAVQALWDGIKAVFSTVFEALRGLWDAFVLAFQGDWEGAWEKVKETALGIWNALPELFSDLFGPLTDIVDWIMQGVISVIRSVFGDDVADHFESVWNAVLVVFEVFEETFLGLWRAFSALFQGDWQTAWDEVKGVATTIWNALPVVFESIINGLIGIADTVMQAVIGVIRSVFGDQVGDVSQTAWDTIVAVFEAGRDIVLGIWQALTAVFQGDWAAAWEAIQGVVQTAWGAIENVIQSGLEIVNTIIDGALNGIVALVRWAFGDEAADAVDDGLEVIRTIVDTVTTVILGIVRTFSALLQGDWEGAWDEIKGVATTIWNSLPVIFEQAINTLVGIADTVMTAVIGVIRSVFGDEVAGVFETAWDAVRTVFEAARDVLLGIWTALTAAFQGDWETAWAAIRGVVDTAWSAIQTVIESALEIINTVISGALDGIVALVRFAFGDEAADAVDSGLEVVRTIVDTVTQAILGIVRAFGALLKGDWQTAWEEIKAVAVNVWNSLPEIFEQSMNLLTGIADTIMRAIIEGIRAVFGDDVAEHFQGIWDAVMTAFEVFEQAFLGIWRAFSAAFRGDWETAWDELKGVFWTVWDALPGIVRGVLDGLFGIVDTAMQALIDLIRRVFGDQVADIFQAAWDAVVIIFETVRDTILGLLAVFTAVFRGDWEAAWQGIKDVFAGIWSGITSIFMGPLNGLVNWVAQWAGRIVGSFVALKDLALEYISGLVNGIVEWFSETKLGKTFNWIGEQVRGVIGWFYDMYDKVVGHSYVPDMVEEIGEAIQRLKDRLANPVVRYTRDVILAFEDMEDEVVASMMSMAERLDDVLKTIVDRITKMIGDVTRAFWNGTATWSSILHTFAGTIGSIFGAVFDAIAKELVSNLILQNEWIISTLANIATTITAYLSQAYAALTAFFWFLGPGAPVAAAATIAAAIAGIAAIGGKILRGLLPDPPDGSGGPSYDGGSGRPSGGRQVSEITGPTRDLLIDLLTPLASLNVLTGIGERIYNLLDDRLPAPVGLQFAGAGSVGYGAPQITFQPGAVVVYSHAGTIQELTGDAVDEIYRQLSERLERSFRGRGR